MVSDFRKKKLLHVFTAFFDTNNSGSIDKKDFELAVEKISALRGWKAGDAKYKETQDTLLKIWAGLQSRADADNDGQVSTDEWIAMWDSYAQNPSSALEWQNLYAKFIFQLEDASNDGSIDSEEFSTVYVSFGLNKAECVEAFKKMSKGKAEVSWAEFQNLWKEYFASEDPNAAGNFIFAVPPSQTAPETVSLLQQPVQNQKYASIIVIQGRSGYTREKARPRLAMYSSQLPNNQYTNYGQQQSPNSQATISIERGQTRQSQPQMHYLQPNTVESYKAKPQTSTVNARAFKMPSPPLVPTSSQQKLG